jgi:hypothetical protein
MTHETSPSGSAFALVAAHEIGARAAVETLVGRAVVLVDLAMFAFPAARTQTVIAAVVILARTAVFAHVAARTLIHVDLTVFALIRARTDARIVANAVHALTAVLTSMTDTVVDVRLTGNTRVSRRAFAVILVVAILFTSSAVVTWIRIARHIDRLATFARISDRTRTSVRTVQIHACTADARIRSLFTFVNILAACCARKSRSTLTMKQIIIVRRYALTLIQARGGRTMIDELTARSSKSDGALALEFVDAEWSENAVTIVQTRLLGTCV